MRHNPFILLLALFSLFCVRSFGQGEKIIETIWSSESAYSIGDGNLISYKAIWKIYEDRIEWLQPGEKYNYTFQLNNLIGNWDPESLTGKISAEVVFRGRLGSIDFVRNSEEAFLKISIQSDEGELFPFRFNISTVGKN